MLFAAQPDSDCQTLGILTTLWGRPGLTRRVLEYYANLRIPSVRLMAVTSPGDEQDVPEAWETVEAPNDPLGAKWNAGLRALRGVDAVLIIGSDDLISPGYFDRIIRQLKDGTDYITLRDLYLYDGDRLAYAHSAMPGGGRVVSSRVLDLVGWRLWQEDANAMLDGTIGARLRDVGMQNHHIRGMIDEDFALLSVRTEENMWDWQGDSLVRNNTRLKFRRLTPIDPEPFLEKYFPGVL